MNKYRIKSNKEISKVMFLDIYMTGHNGYIAGGCFKNIFNGQRIKDIDIFFLTKEDFIEACEYYDDNENYVFSYENNNTKAFKNKETNIRLELICSQFGEPLDILSKFDFSITKFAYYKDKSEDETEYKCMYHEDFFEHLIAKKLVVEKDIFFPVSTFNRVLRYSRYGYGLCRESKINIINSLQGQNPESISDELYFGFD